MFFLNSLILDIVKYGRCFGNVTIYILFINKVYLLKYMVVEAFILRT
jgi:hypothetical protein